MLLPMKPTILAAFWLSGAFSLQLPFQWPSTEKPTHYSSLSQELWPVDLKQYHGEQVLRVSYGGNEALWETLAASDEIKFKKWALHPSQAAVDVQIDAHNLQLLEKQFPNLNYLVIIDDLSQKVYETYPKDFTAGNPGARAAAHDEVMEATRANVLLEIFFRDYRPLETINQWLDLLAQLFPQLLAIEDIGNTYEGRPYKVVHLSVPDDDVEHHEKKTIVITGGVHAREWILVSSVLYVIYEMVSLYENSPEEHKVLANLDFLFIPVLNPDGYEYTWTHDRLWRKNRQQTPDPNCFGIDIDHLYDFHWTRSTDSECGEEYSGNSPFEAYESRIWDEYLNNTNHNHQIYGYIDLHSYAQEILYPYAFSCAQQPRDEENLIELAYGISKAIRMLLGKYYDVLPACLDRDSDLLPDLGSGSALDYMYHNKAYWAYQLKLRDSGLHGFLLPSKYIEPVGQEIASGLSYFCRFILADD